MSVWPAPARHGLGDTVLADPTSIPDVLPFDPTLPYTRTDNLQINKGCPLGYFAQFVTAGSDSAVFVQIPGLVQGSYIRCRKMEGYTAQINAAETGENSAQAWYDFTNTGLGLGFGDLLDHLKNGAVLLGGTLAAIMLYKILK